MNQILIDIPEIIETPRLLLQMPKAGAGKALYEAMLDGYEDYVKYLNWSSVQPSVDAIEEECRKHHAEFILRTGIRYLIIEKSSGKLVGRTAFAPPQANWVIPQFGIAYFIRKSCRANGYASEAAQALTLLAFRVLDAKKVEIHCDIENVASNRIPQKLNFKHEYTKRGDWPRPDKQLAEIKVYSVFEEAQLLEMDVKW